MDPARDHAHSSSAAQGAKGHQHRVHDQRKGRQEKAGEQCQHPAGTITHRDCIRSDHLHEYEGADQDDESADTKPP